MMSYWVLFIGIASCQLVGTDEFAKTNSRSTLRFLQETE